MLETPDNGCDHRVRAAVFLRWLVTVLTAVGAPSLPAREAAAEQSLGPYDRQVAAQCDRLRSDSARTRARAAEFLGFLRAYGAEGALLERLRDSSLTVRCQVAMALAWCGSRAAVPALLNVLDDDERLVRQAAYVSLTNLTGMEFPFDADARGPQRALQAAVWRDWWADVPAGEIPPDVLKLLDVGTADAWSVTASTTYRGPPEILVDGQIGPEYWQTKNVDPPQWCTIDLGQTHTISRVTVHQYGAGFCLTDYELATSVDGRLFETAELAQGKTPTTLVINMAPRQARYVRVTSFASENPRYPTTFFEIEIDGIESPSRRNADVTVWQRERAARALGALGGAGAAEAILKLLGPDPTSNPRHRPVVRAALRALGRLRDESGLQYLLRMLDHPQWARYAADALGDLGDRRAVPALLAAYPRYAKQLDDKDPSALPADDKTGFPHEDRMFETAFWIAYALCRLPLDDARAQQDLYGLAPLLMTNLPGDLDTFILYDPEAGHLLTRFLLEQSGRRQEACEHALSVLGQLRPMGQAAVSSEWPVLSPARMASWLPAVCTEPEDCPRLLALLSHADGWVRLNACKALAWSGNRDAIAPLARLLADSQAEADYGYSATFKDEEYNDPAPRWREGLLRSLGLLGAHEETEAIIRVLNDQRSVLEVRRAAADALADLGSDPALAALQQAAISHDFASIRHVAGDALRARGKKPAASLTTPTAAQAPVVGQPPRTARAGGDPWAAVVFVQGDNDVPNTPQTVEQADRWRQTYVVTDEGPTYRPGNNLFVLRPARPDGVVTQLTHFTEGYVADPEVSWDGSEVVFCHREQADPWWQLFTVNTDGSNLRQLTKGPYHSVQPAWLPDGRIVFASSRVGTRDEYHGYPCTALCVTDRNGHQQQLIATNIGRDNEPAVLPDGRIVFSRLEVFYSRNKTELTLHAVHPDGTQDVVVYGPERRSFWRQLDHGDPDPADVQEAPLTHRVLRMTQPQPMPGGREIVVCTQGGLTLLGPERDRERLICPDFRDYAYTTPYPLPDGRILCSVTRKTPNRKEVDLGIYVFDARSGQRTLVFNDPRYAEYDARPIMTRPAPAAALPESTPAGDSGQFLCASVFTTQEPEVALRGRFVRLIEGVPQVGRHNTHTNPEPVWRNHGGTLARVLGTVPLASDGSFFIQVPADRLLHLQVLDSDRKVVGNQLTWIYPRPGETKSCVGCHERPHSTALGGSPLAAAHPPVDLVPRGDEFVYRAKAWFKGSLPPEIEERTRTVHAVNLLGR